MGNYLLGDEWELALKRIPAGDPCWRGNWQDLKIRRSDFMSHLSPDIVSAKKIKEAAQRKREYLRARLNWRAS